MINSTQEFTFEEVNVRFTMNDQRGYPVFIYLPHTMPHVPLYVSDKFKGKSEQGMYGDVMMEIDWSKKSPLFKK